MATWREDVVDALLALGGQASLPEIYEEISRAAKRELPENWKSIVRRELEYNSSDSDAYIGKADLFFSVNGIGSGIWGLRQDGANEV